MSGDWLLCVRGDAEQGQDLCDPAWQTAILWIYSSDVHVDFLNQT